MHARRKKGHRLILTDYSNIHYSIFNVAYHISADIILQTKIVITALESFHVSPLRVQKRCKIGSIANILTLTKWRQFKGCVTTTIDYDYNHDRKYDTTFHHHHYHIERSSFLDLRLFNHSVLRSNYLVFQTLSLFWKREEADPR